MTDPATSGDDDQIAFWNGPGGTQWAREQARTDRFMAPIADLLTERAAARPGERAIDVGCGTGVTTAMLAEQVGPTGRVLALDVSGALLDAARARLAGYTQVEFRLGNAATENLSDRQADLLFSRFGIMFFADPMVAFRNLGIGLREGGRFVFACWRAPTENLWMSVPMAALLPCLPPEARPEPTPPNSPGPFAFADRDRLARILADTGFRAIEIEPINLALDLAGGQGLDEATALAANLGPGARLLINQSDNVRQAAIAAIREALGPYEDAGLVKLPAAIWLVSAQVG